MYQRFSVFLFNGKWKKIYRYFMVQSQILYLSYMNSTKWNGITLLNNGNNFNNFRVYLLQLLSFIFIVCEKIVFLKLNLYDEEN